MRFTLIQSVSPNSFTCTTLILTLQTKHQLNTSGDLKNNVMLFSRLVLAKSLMQSFFDSQKSTKLWPRKYDLNLYRKIFMGEMVQIHQIVNDKFQ
jgi:hypothetical protein